MTRRLIFTLSTAVFVVGCSGEHAPTGNDVPQVVTLPSGIEVDLFPDGSLLVKRPDGSTLIARGAPVFGVFRDADGSKWHDPTDLADLTFEAPLHRSTSLVQRAGEDAAVVVRLADQGADAALVSFGIPIDDGAYLGLGERFDHVDAKGTMAPMFLGIQGANESGTNDAHVPVPFVVDTRGYGVFVDTLRTGAVDVGSASSDLLRLTFDQTKMDVVLYLPASGKPLDAAERHATDTGAGRPLPLWSLAPMHWRNEWTDAAMLLGDLDVYRTLHIPASCVWIDNPWETSYNDATLDPARFGDPAQLMSDIAARGFKTIAWSTPYLDKPTGAPQNPAQQLWVEADAKGYFVKADGKTYGAIGCCVESPGMIDFTNPKATEFWQGILKHATDSGFVGFKLDYGEDLVPSILGVRVPIQLHDGETERDARVYPQLYDDAYAGALEAAKVPDDGFIIGRASSTGGATKLHAIWPGDLDNGFQKHEPKHVGGLPAAVVAAQTLATSGFSVFGSDIGGFRDGMPTREALLRWAEHSAFTYVMQLGGGGDHHNPWLYDAAAGQIYKGLAQQHMQLVPYLAAQLDAARVGKTISIQSLPLAFPDDAAGFPFADSEYLLGRDILVAPVVEAGATSREVHFPTGTWVHWFTRQRFQGPKTATVAAPLGSPPVFARASSVIPEFNEALETLVAASQPGILDPDAMLDHEVRWIPMAGAVDELGALWPSGERLTIGEHYPNFSLKWRGSPTRGLVATIDVAGIGVDLKKVHDKGGAPRLATEADVRAATGNAFAVDEARGLMFVRIGPNGSVDFI